MARGPYYAVRRSPRPVSPKALSQGGGSETYEQDLAARVMRVRALSFPNDITPAQITANQNDYNPEGWEAATVLRISSNGNYNITGHVAPQESARGRFLVYRNINALGGGTLTLPDQSALSAASSRWAFPGGNIDVAPLDGIAFLYDFTELRWFVFGDPVGPAETVAAAGLVLITVATLSAQATVEFTAFDATLYSSYLFVLENVIPATDNVDLWLRTSTDGGANYDAGVSDYAHFTRENTMQVSDVSASAGDEADSEIQLTTANQGNAANEKLSMMIWVYKPDDADYTKFTFEGVYSGTTTVFRHVFGGGIRLSAADVNAVRFLFSSGNLTSGRILFYGLRRAV